jgi:hypothetical protein
MTEVDLKIVGEVQTLRLESPSDIVLLELKGETTPDEAEAIRHMFEQLIDHSNPVITLIDGLRVKKIIHRFEKKK